METPNLIERKFKEINWPYFRSLYQETENKLSDSTLHLLTIFHALFDDDFGQ